jgi:amino acid transporter
MSLKLSKLFSILVLACTLILAFLPISLNAATQYAQLAPGRDVICGGPCPLVDGEFDFNREGLVDFILSFARFLTFIGVALAVLFMVFAGVQYIFGKSEDAKSNIISTLIGLVIIIVAYTFVVIVTSLLQSNALGEVIGGSGNF